MSGDQSGCAPWDYMYLQLRLKVRHQLKKILMPALANYVIDRGWAESLLGFGKPIEGILHIGKITAPTEDVV